MKKRERSQYFQLIAHNFLHARGVPFFLSSTDLELIATWEKMGIPLQVVLEGIERTFENQRLRPGERSKIHSLAFCRLQVLKAFEQYKERKVGSRKGTYERDEKRKKIKNEVRKFLRDLPPDLEYLREVYGRAQNMLSPRNVKEDELERVEEEIEELLFRHCSQKEREKVKSEILDRYPYRREEEFRYLLKIKLVKFVRDRYKIPYISFFYY